MAALISRQHQIPGGFKFAIPQLKWQSPPFASFDTIVNSVLNLLRANPEVARQMGWSDVRKDIEALVDRTNADFCENMGWKEYYIPSEGPAPATPAPKWPIWARGVALLKSDGEVGVGDTVEATIGAENSEAFKAFYQKTFGRPCGCNGRKAEWNAKYRY